MEKQILKDVSLEERKKILQETANGVEKFTFQRELELAEVQEIQSGLSQKLIAIVQEDQKLKVAKEAYKAVVNPKREAVRADLQKIRTQMEEVTEEVFLMKDLDKQKMGYYSMEGKLVFERNLKADEMQYSIADYTNKKTGTNE